MNITALLLDLYYLHDISQYVAINTFHVSCCSGFYCSVWKTWTPASANSTHDSSLSVANPLMSSQGSLRFQLTEYLHFSTVIILRRITFLIYEISWIINNKKVLFKWVIFILILALSFTIVCLWVNILPPLMVWFCNASRSGTLLVCPTSTTLSHLERSEMQPSEAGQWGRRGGDSFASLTRSTIWTSEYF